MRKFLRTIMLLLCVLFVPQGMMAIESTHTVKDGVLYLNMAEGETFDSFGDANTIRGIFGSYSTVVITGNVTAADVKKIGGDPYGGSVKTVDLSLSQLPASETVIDQGTTQVILRKDSKIESNPWVYGGSNYGMTLKYVVSPSYDYKQTGSYSDVVVALTNDFYTPSNGVMDNQYSWREDPVVLRAEKIYIQNDNVTNAQLEAWSTELGKNVVRYDESQVDRQNREVGDVVPTSGTFTVTDKGGSLAEQIALANENADPAYDYFIIKGGVYTAEDIAALQNLTCAKNIIMDEAVLTDDAKKANFNFNSEKIEYVVLPKDLEEVKSEWFSGCSSLKSAISYKSDGTSLKAYNRVAGELKGAINLLISKNPDNALAEAASGTGVGYQLKALKELVISGNVNANDLDKSGSMTGRPMEHFDLTNATLVGDDRVTQDDEVLAYTGYLAGSGYATSVRKVDFPTSLKKIPANCYEECNQLGDVFITRNIEEIGEKAFYRNDGIETVEFEKRTASDPSLTCGESIFEQCSNLLHIILPEGTTNVAKRMFALCPKLESLRIPNTLTTIGDGAFEEAESLHNLTIPKSVSTIGQNAFKNSGITDLYLMAETIEELPVIYSVGYGAYSAGFGPASSEKLEDATFGAYSLYGDDQHIGKDAFRDFLKRLARLGQVDGHPEMTEAQVNALSDDEVFSYLTSSQMEEVYRSFRYTKLHYVHNDELDAFLNGNPWKGKMTDEEIAKLASQMGEYDTGQHQNQFEAERYNTVEHLSDGYGYGPDKYEEIWPNHNHYDLGMRIIYGNPADVVNTSDTYTYSITNEDGSTTTINSSVWANEGSEPSRIGWRQFVLMSGFDPQEDEVYAKDYDDTWYTFCFPADLTDEQLEGAFNSNFNIVEFNGVAVNETDTDPVTNEPYLDAEGNPTTVKNLILLFTNIATTYYRDVFGNYYTRTKDADGNKEYTPATLTKNQFGHYTLTPIAGATTLTVNTTNEDEQYLYGTIRGVLAQGGHPYMIHPQKVEDVYGHATQCVINHVEYKFDYNKKKKAAEAEGATQAQIDAYNEARTALTKLYKEDEIVTRKLTKFKEVSDVSMANPEGDTDYANMKAGRVLLEPLGGDETYTFVGSFEPDKTVAIPNRAYFLGVPPGTKYPKYFRETNGNTTTGYWGQFSAVIIPNDAAKAWEDTNIEVKPYSSSSNAKAVSMGFGDFEEVTADEIKEIVADAKEKKQPVQFMNVIVNINGQVVRDGLDMTGLPKGIYIVNGKKYMVK